MRKWKEKMKIFKKPIKNLFNKRIIRPWGLATRFENKKIEKSKKKKQK